MNQYPKIVPLILCLYLSNFSLNAQKNTAIKLNLANIIIEDFPTIQVEKSLFKSNSIQFGVGFYSRKHQSLPVDILNSTINGKPAREVFFDEEKRCLLTVDFRQYFTKSKTSLTGFYISPHVMTNYPLFEKLMVGANIGYQQIIKNKLVVNIGGGWTKELDRKDVKREVGTQPRLQIGLGWGF